MRVLKFRQAVYLDDKFHHWHYWGFLPDLTFVGPDTVNGLAHALANSQQFTGLLDKLRVEIYEGDWVHVEIERDDMSLKGYVDFADGSFRVNAGYTKGYRWIDYEVEVVGNIHQNPELLGSKGNE